MKKISLTQGKEALIDDEDYTRVSKFQWHAFKNRRRFYAVTNIRKSDGSKAGLYMHRLLLPDSEQVDHINGDGLDNRRENIRAATAVENLRAFKRKRENASSIYRGVSWHKPRQKWRSRLRKEGKNFFLGFFANEKEAARAYDKAARELFGDFASPNLVLTNK